MPAYQAQPVLGLVSRDEDAWTFAGRISSQTADPFV